MAAVGQATIEVHLDIQINGEPVTKIMKAPAELEEPRDTPDGLVLHLHIDAIELAHILYPIICEIGKDQAKSL